MSDLKYRKIGLYCNRRKPKAMALARVVFQRLRELGAEPLLARDIEALVGLPGKVENRADLCAKSEALVVLGGDGTLLHAARDSYPYQIPILGVNIGYLGFLSETTTGELDEQLEKLVRGDFHSSSRMALWVKVCRGEEGRVVFESPVINEVLIYRRAKGRLLELETFINAEFLTQYRADGLLVSTPTGSTGHSMSAGGPILKPEMRAILVTPICAHTLASRSIGLDERDVVEVRIKPEDEDVSLTVDGQMDEALSGGDTVRINQGNHPITLVGPGRVSFYEVLRKKLYLGRVSGSGGEETPGGGAPL